MAWTKLLSKWLHLCFVTCEKKKKKNSFTHWIAATKFSKFFPSEGHQTSASFLWSWKLHRTSCQNDWNISMIQIKENSFLSFPFSPSLQGNGNFSLEEAIHLYKKRGMQSSFSPVTLDQISFQPPYFLFSLWFLSWWLLLFNYRWALYP